MHGVLRSPLLGRLALLSALLTACGAPLVAPQQGSSSEATQIMTVKLGAGASRTVLSASYPGSRLLAYRPADGYAVLAVRDTQPRFRSQAVSVVAVEANVVVQTDLMPTQRTGVWVDGGQADTDGGGASSDGKGAWAEGKGAWAEGALDGSSSQLTSNQSVWNSLELSYGQKLVPELGKGVTVAVLDTGVDLGHPAFADKLDARGYDYVSRDSAPQDESGGAAYGHGTAVTGLVLQVAPGATILPMRVLAADGSGTLANIISAVYDSASDGARVINLSLGSGSNSAALNAAIAAAVKGGATVVAAAGNTGLQGLVYPAQNAGNVLSSMGGGLISVGSVNGSLLKSSFSAYGASMTLTAPGERLATTYPGKLQVLASGTSFATPIVSGAVALAYSAGVSSAAQIQSDLQASSTPNADSVYTPLMGKGTIDIGRFLHRYR